MGPWNPAPPELYLTCLELSGNCKTGALVDSALSARELRCHSQQHLYQGRPNGGPAQLQHGLLFSFALLYQKKGGSRELCWGAIRSPRPNARSLRITPAGLCAPSWLLGVAPRSCPFHSLWCLSLSPREKLARKFLTGWLSSCAMSSSSANHNNCAG